MSEPRVDLDALIASIEQECKAQGWRFTDRDRRMIAAHPAWFAGGAAIETDRQMIAARLRAARVLERGVICFGLVTLVGAAQLAFVPEPWRRPYALITILCCSLAVLCAALLIVHNEGTLRLLTGPRCGAW